MRKFMFLSIIVILSVILAGCSLFGAKGKVYITTATRASCSLITVKVTAVGANAGGYPNIYANNSGTVSYDGKTWRVYDVDEGSWDIYTEWNNPGFSNDRKTIFLDADSSANAWSAHWVAANDPNEMPVLQGSGPLSLGSPYPNW